MKALVLLLVAAAPALSAQQKTRVGAEACAACHEDMAKAAKRSVHTECEACHGPGSVHAENPSKQNIIAFQTEAASLRSGQCLACHGQARSMHNFRRSEHSTRQVSCDQCHSKGVAPAFHRLRAAADTLKGREPELCYTCHGEQRAAFSLPFHHPVKSGSMACSGCHAPHGEYTLRQARTRHNDAVCASCHEEKAGPFVYEHGAVRSQGCSGCHQPHGSANPRMLTRPQVQFLCLECHTRTPRSHDLAQTRYRNCTVCHSQIHGSNLSRLLLE
ncbi:MAG: DmsE family decaheme c-type cytochrome [Acidobacteria bacterium]|nr:DmsE family decaheme c-type cytochrome [Acidobacteriota bacterium]